MASEMTRPQRVIFSGFYSSLRGERGIEVVNSSAPRRWGGDLNHVIFKQM